LKTEINIYKTRWLDLFSNPDLSEKAENEYHALLNMYSQGHRVYHNFDHITACIKHLDTVKDKLESPLAVELAIWFHDCIYNIFSRQNEEKSARYAVDRLAALQVEEEIIVQVNKLIMTTMHPAAPESHDERFMADIDIAVLGSSADAYKAYETAIRYEYKWIPGFVYRKQRSLLLQSFLKQERIYMTDYFFNKFEATARENIAAAIEKLKA